jgi:hypothetical protein
MMGMSLKILYMELAYFRVFLELSTGDGRVGDVKHWSLLNFVFYITIHFIGTYLIMQYTMN